jgi:hypothetical protein
MSATSSLFAQPATFEATIASLKQGVDAAVAAQTEASARVIKTAKDVAAFNQGSFAATGEASRILAAGLTDLFRQIAASSQEAFADASSSLRAITTAATVQEKLELQTNFVRTSTTRAVSEASRFARAGVELADKASAPLLARATLAVETLTTVAV